MQPYMFEMLLGINNNNINYKLFITIDNYLTGVII